MAFITGMQGADREHLLVATTAKHFAVHSGPELLRHGFDARPPPTIWRIRTCPAFRAAVVDGHVASVMCVYNAVDGIPGCASPYLLEKTLRDNWGFKGFVVSDCNAVNDIHGGHHYVTARPPLRRLALKAGMDNECTVKFGSHEEDYAKYADAIKQGLLSEADIDRALRRALTVRFRPGHVRSAGSRPPARRSAQLTAPRNRAARAAGGAREHGAAEEQRHAAR